MMSDDTRRGDGTVIPFRGTYKPPETASDQPPAYTLKRGHVDGPCPYGRHRAIVDGQARRVQCGDCNVDLDPFKVLEDAALHHEWYVNRIAENSKLEKELVALKEEVTKLRATRNRLRRGTHG